jgi:acetyl-CoA carboxylase biotin carboxylase subunit
MFRKLLIANRGEIAVRIMRTCREMGIATVAAYSDADRDALHVRRADEAVRIGPAPPAQSYLCLEAVVEAARRTGAEALHPGYGFLAENPELPEMCLAAGIAFVGPPASAIRLMADKAAARELAASLGVPVLPGAAITSHDDAAARELAAGIGFPLIVKALAGGGGRGMRFVLAPEQLPGALGSARREAHAAFGDERLLLERAVTGGRHIEVQVLFDALGCAVHLGERDCSVQRRYQKIIEESPSPAVSPELRERLVAAALAIARAARYVNAGTVEFLVDRAGEFYFLEMNTRLQVEHGVTELATGLDLVELQLRIAAGEPLPVKQHDIRFSGHAIECRIYAEDPARGYLPSSGRITYMLPPEGAGIRNDAGVEAGSAVSTEYDPLLAKLLVHAASREEALERCTRALDAYAIEGVKTNLGLLRAVVAGRAFAAGNADLTTLGQMPPEQFAPRLPDEILLAAAAFDVDRQPAERDGDAWDHLGPWRIDGKRPLEYTYHGGSFALQLQRQVGAANAWRATIDDEHHNFVAAVTARGRVVLRERGTERRWQVVMDGSHLIVESPGHRYVLGRPDLVATGASPAGSAGVSSVVRAPMPGIVTRILVAQGGQVAARQPLLVLEAMKMEHIIESSMDGVVTTIACRAGQKVGEGDVLIELEPLPGRDHAIT